MYDDYEYVIHTIHTINYCKLNELDILSTEGFHAINLENITKKLTFQIFRTICTAWILRKTNK